jgi:predicted RNA-binding protein with TRAM domain
MRFERRSFRGRGFRSGGFRSDRFEDDNTPKPVNVGEEYDVEINEVGSKGDGIARVKNFVIFVSNGKKGEKAKVKIKEVRSRCAIAEKVGEATSEATTEEVGVEESTS